MKIIQTPQQRANTIEALEVMWPSVPPENVYPALSIFRVGDYTRPHTCNTMACFGGWCVAWPAFKIQGADYNLASGTKLFGCGYMFSGRGAHLADRNFCGTDHELVTNRLIWLLNNSEVK